MLKKVSGGFLGLWRILRIGAEKQPFWARVEIEVCGTVCVFYPLNRLTSWTSVERGTREIVFLILSPARIAFEVMFHPFLVAFVRSILAMMIPCLIIFGGTSKRIWPCNKTGYIFWEWPGLPVEFQIPHSNAVYSVEWYQITEVIGRFSWKKDMFHTEQSEIQLSRDCKIDLCKQIGEW